MRLAVESKKAIVTFSLEDGTKIESSVNEKHLATVTALVNNLKECEHEYPDEWYKDIPPDCTRCGVNYRVTNPEVPEKEDVVAELAVAELIVKEARSKT